MIRRSYRTPVDKDRVIKFWQLGLDTFEIASRIGARESDVYRVMAKWRDKRVEANPAVPAKCQPALED